MCVFRTKETPMEHVDALEAVRRLTLERDVLAQQVRRLEDSVVWHREELERMRAEWEQQENAPQAPERRERPETGTELTEGPNGAPEPTTGEKTPTEPQKWDGLFFGGIAIQLKEQYDGTQTCEGCKHWDASAEYEGGYHDCHRHAPTVGEYGPAWPRTTRMSQCGDWEGK